MKLWLAQRFGRTGRTLSSTPAHAAGKAVELLEHSVRGRVRSLLRHTWLVTVLGTVILAGAVWLAFYLTSHGAVMKVAAGPADGVDVRLVELLAKKIRAGRRQDRTAAGHHVRAGAKHAGDCRPFSRPRNFAQQCRRLGGVLAAAQPHHQAEHHAVVAVQYLVQVSVAVLSVGAIAPAHLSSTVRRMTGIGPRTLFSVSADY